MTFNRINRILKKRVSEKKSPKDIYNNYSAVKIADLEDDEVQDNEAGVMMTQATEQKLLLRLREFENSTLFTKKYFALLPGHLLWS